jgi:hypothetical protein
VVVVVVVVMQCEISATCSSIKILGHFKPRREPEIFSMAMVLLHERIRSYVYARFALQVTLLEGDVTGAQSFVSGLATSGKLDEDSGRMPYSSGMAQARRVLGGRIERREPKCTKFI